MPRAAGKGVGRTFQDLRLFDLYTVNWILDNFLGSIILVIIVIFQSDIRRALTQVGSAPLFGTAERMALRREDIIEEVAQAAVALSEKKVGGLIVLERDVGLNEYMEIGTRLFAGDRIGQRRIVDVDGAIAAHGQRRAQRLLGAIGAERHGHHLALAALFLDAQRLLDGELVVGRDDPGDAAGVDLLAVAADLHLRGGVGHLLDHDQDLHDVLAPRASSGSLGPES